MTLRDLAFKKKYTPADPSVFGSVASYAIVKSFKCAWRAVTAEQQIRAGRDSEEKAIRIWYRPIDVELSNGDRVALSGVDYDIFYVDPPRTRTGIVFADCKVVP